MGKCFHNELFRSSFGWKNTLKRYSERTMREDTLEKRKGVQDLPMATNISVE